MCSQIIVHVKGSHHLNGTALLLGQQAQIRKGYDAVRKSDLENIRIALEHYFSDKGCYPPQAIFNVCGGPGLQPYLDAIPCDPETKQPYTIKLESATTCSQKYYLYANAGTSTDPDITCNAKYYVRSPNVSDSELYSICMGESICKNGYHACILGACQLVSIAEKPACAPIFCESNCQNSCDLPGFEVDPQPCTP